jgi:uncharacterized protein YggT (Ycf19 family)
MALLDFILNLVGLLLWFNWRAARFDPLTKSRPATLAGTLRRAEKSSLKRWHLPLGLVGLLLLRVPLYASFGAALNWTGKLDVAAISIPFRSDTPSYLPMLLYSFYSFGVMLTTFLFWMLLLSILKSGASESDSLRQVLRLHLGRVESWPRPVKWLLPILVIPPLWWAASWPLTAAGILPTPGSGWQRFEQALLIGAGSYLAWEYFIVAVLALYFVSSYVYFGRQPFWQHLEVVGRLLLKPLRVLPLRWGKLDVAPWVGIALVVWAAHVFEHGLKTPERRHPDGRPQPRLIEVPGLVDWYERVSR